MTGDELDELQTALTVPGFAATARPAGATVLIYWTATAGTWPPEDPSLFRVPGSFAEAIIEPVDTMIRWHRLFVGTVAAAAGIFTACLRYAVAVDADSVVAAGSPLADTLQALGFDVDDVGDLTINKPAVAAWLDAHDTTVP